MKRKPTTGPLRKLEQYLSSPQIQKSIKRTEQYLRRLGATPRKVCKRPSTGKWGSHVS